jgi:hypothetical protein
MRTMPPNGSDFLAAYRLPGILSIPDGFTAQQKLPVRSDNHGWDRWSTADSSVSNATKYDKRREHDHAQRDPKPLVSH